MPMVLSVSMAKVTSSFFCAEGGWSQNLKLLLISSKRDGKERKQTAENNLETVFSPQRPGLVGAEINWMMVFSLIFENLKSVTVSEK